MGKWIFAFALLPVCAANAFGDYVLDRQAAVALVRAGKHTEAMAAFSRLADGTASDVQKSDALRQAASCAQGLNEYGRALEFAKKIPLVHLSKTCQMQVMEGQRRPKDIVDRFKDEAIEKWPESVRGDAYFARGHAYFIIKNGAAAAKDLSMASEFLMDGNAKGLCLICLGDTYASLLKDDKQAIAAYRKTYETGNVYKHCQAAINVAGILQRQGNPAAAVEELNRIKMAEVTAPYWRGSMLVAMGSAFVGAGKKAEAASRYKEALAIEGLPAGLRKECEAALKKVTTDSK